jgi:hypothetical protein
MRKNLAALLATVVGAIVLLAGWKIHSDATDHLAGTRILGGFNVGVPANPRQFIAELGRMMGRLGEDVVIFNMPVDVRRLSLFWKATISSGVKDLAVTLA